ncbi:MAG: BON domain-containing protein [Bacillota bacterium]
MAELPEGLDRDLGDTTVSSRVIVQLRVHDQTAAFAKQIRVGTLKRRVYLHGTVPSEDARRRAERVVRTVEGVGGVVNLLEVTG